MDGFVTFIKVVAIKKNKLLKHCTHKKECLHLTLKMNNAIYVNFCFWHRSAMKSFQFLNYHEKYFTFNWLSS